MIGTTLSHYHFGCAHAIGCLAGAIVDRVRRKAAILGALHFWSLICMATAVSRNFFHLFCSGRGRGSERRFVSPPR
jgi:predicted MFS family arabinose efflux permease